MFMCMFDEEDDVSAWSNNQFILLVISKWIEDQVWM